MPPAASKKPAAAGDRTVTPQTSHKARPSKDGAAAKSVAKQVKKKKSLKKVAATPGEAPREEADEDALPDISEAAEEVDGPRTSLFTSYVSWDPGAKLFSTYAVSIPTSTNVAFSDLSNTIVSVPANSPTSSPGFIASQSFAGVRSGFVFKLGGAGLGYYPDEPPLLIDPAVLAALVAESEASSFKAAPAIDEEKISMTMSVKLSSLGVDTETPAKEVERLKTLLTEQRKALGETHAETLASMRRLGKLLGDQLGDLEGAAALLQQAVSKHQEVRGGKHEETAGCMCEFAAVLAKRGDREAAAELLREALAAQREVLGSRHADTMCTMSTLAQLLKRQEGMVEQAAALMREVLDAKRAALGEKHEETISAMSNLGVTISGQGHVEEARTLLRQASSSAEEVLGEYHPKTKNYKRQLSRLEPE